MADWSKNKRFSAETYLYLEYHKFNVYRKKYIRSGRDSAVVGIVLDYQLHPNTSHIHTYMYG